MNKPDESTLIAYLYGELDAKETEKVVKYLNQNPDVEKNCNNLAMCREF